MSKQTTDIIFILDRSGSMSGLESDTIGGYNSYLEKQRKLEGEAFVTTVLFDDRYKMLHRRIDIKEIQDLTSEDYFVRGSTALLDAIGNTIDQFKLLQSEKNKTLMVIITDGLENASREFTYKRVKQLIDQQQENQGWEFIFLGANIDAVKEGERFGISEDRSVSYHADSQGTALNFACVTEATISYRSTGDIPKRWKQKIEEDLSGRENGTKK